MSNLNTLRNTYRRMLGHWEHMGCGPQVRDKIAGMGPGLDPQEYLDALTEHTDACPHCGGTGRYHTNGKDRGSCYRCEGSGIVTYADAKRYAGWEWHRGQSGLRTMEMGDAESLARDARESA